MNERKSPDINMITEKHNQNSKDLDQMVTRDIVELLNDEDIKAAKAVGKISDKIADFIDKLASRMKKGGRLIYVGAGTSGRMGVLDAVECTPTFGLDSERIKGIIAGGRQAMFNAFEDLEDNKNLGRRRIDEENLNERDTVLGIAASGKTPFVVGAVERAGEKGVLTGALVCNHDTKLAQKADLELKVIVGPEVLAGSTRLKAGTAQKMVLNTISTTVMSRLNRVYSNLMVDLEVNNKKLQKRAERIFLKITDSEWKAARNYLGMSDYDVKKAVVMFEKGVDIEKAAELLQSYNGDLRKIIG